MWNKMAAKAESQSQNSALGSASKHSRGEVTPFLAELSVTEVKRWFRAWRVCTRVKARLCRLSNAAVNAFK